MKKYPLIVVALILIASFMAVSQTGDSVLVRWKNAMADNDEYIHALLTADRNVLENARALIHDLKTKKAVFEKITQYHVDEMGRSIKASEFYLTEMTKATDIAIDQIYIGYLNNLHRYYRKSLEELSGIQAELKKTPPQKSVITMKATTIYAEMKKAEEEQIKMHGNMGVEEPGEPEPAGK
jgi:uncharacterized protein YoxC